MDVENNAEFQEEKELLSMKFRFITVRNISSAVAKYLPGATPYDRKQGPQYCWMYVGAIAHLSNSEGNYSNDIIKLHLGKKHRQQISSFRKLHQKHMDKNGRYAKLFIMVLNDLRKIEDKKTEQYKKALTK
jgi:hypothetical protein